MKELYCTQCEEYKSEDEFTAFSRNPALADRNSKVVMCRDCCSKRIDKLGNTKEGLREVLRMIDVPFLESYADRAISKYEAKIKNTNIVIKKNVHSNEETMAGIEGVKQQNNLYTCYVAMIGLIPAKYINYATSDGVRNEVVENSMEYQTEKQKEEQEKKKALRLITKLFDKQIFSDKERLSKAVRLKYDELSLYANDSSKRGEKFRLKNAILLLIENGELDKDDYLFLYEKKDNSTKHTMVVDVDPSSIGNNSVDDDYPVDLTGVETDTGFMDIDKLKSKWGRKYKAEDLIEFEKKYNELKMNYKLQTASHEEFLRHACIASVRANDAMASGDVDSAKTWMKIFQDTTNSAKLQPNQFSKADLSGGLATFSELYKRVEETYNVIDIIPELYDTPRDKADFVIYCLVNYIRRLKGMNDVEYKDIYKFYEEMESQFIDTDDDDNIDIEKFLEG